MSMKSAIHVVILAACLGSLSTIAAAANDEAPQRIVRFGDLDLANAEGAGALYGRIKDAAKEVCAPENASNLQQRAFAYRCTEKAIARAVEEVNVPLLNSYYRTRARTAIAIVGR
jgi:UrcA family protein